MRAAERPPGPAPDVMICEATYGVQAHEPQAERERRFTSRVHEIVQRGGRCLLPVFALGKAHELLLILDEYWEKHPELRSVPIYYASSLTKKCLTIYSTYLHMMGTGSDGASASITSSNIFRHVTSLRGAAAGQAASLPGPCVVMASPGMLQSGLSRDLLEAWCGDARNGLILTGYSVEGTLAKSLLQGEPTEISSLSTKRALPFRMAVESISFSAHVDFIQNAHFIEELSPRHLVLVHGEYNEMMRLRNALQHKYDAEAEHKSGDIAASAATTVHTPRNCEALEIAFGERRVARVAGSLAAALHAAGVADVASNGEDIANATPTSPKPMSLPSVDAVALLDRGWELTIAAPEDLAAHSSGMLRQGSASGAVRVTSSAPWALVHEQVLVNFSFLQVVQLVGAANVRSSTVDGMLSLLQGEITLVAEDGGLSLLVSWRSSSPLVEMMADALVAMLTAVEGTPASISTCCSATKKDHIHGSEKGHTDHDHGPDAGCYRTSDAIGELLANYYEEVQRVSDGWEIIVAEKQEKAPYHLRITSGTQSPIVVGFIFQSA